MDILTRARNYAAKCPPAVSGQGGHNQTFSLAVTLVHGFSLSEQDALRILSDYNLTCSPPWSEAELEHKIKSAAQSVPDKPRGWLVGPQTHSGSLGQSTYPQPSKAAARPQGGNPLARKYTLDEDAELPESMADGCRVLIRSLFSPGEGIGIAQEIINEDKRGVPRGGGATLSREDWLDRLDGAKGDPNKIFSSSNKTGAFIRVNPLKIGGTKDGDVTDFRIALLEFDQMSSSDQWSLIQQSNVPCEAVLFSGGKSIHAWVKVEAANIEEYKERVKLLFDHFAPYGLDEKNKNPSRFSRLPGMRRGNSRQELLCLKCGAESWEEWAAEQVDLGLPPIASWERLSKAEMSEPPQLVKGVLHLGSKLVFGGGSKSYKTFALIDLAISIACGVPWWGFPTLQHRVLYINFEIQEYFFRERIQKISAAKNVTLKGSMFDSWNLRGYCASLDELIPKIIKGIKSKTYGLIVLDPIYKALGRRDENRAGEMADLLNHVEQLTVRTGAASAFGAHFSKGWQSDKQAIDRIGGSGVFARDPDAILTMTPHEESDHLSVDFKLRNFAPKESVVVKWKHPLFEVDLQKDPAKLSKPKREEKKVLGDKEARAVILGNVPTDKPIGKNDLKAKSQSSGVAVNRFNPLVEAMLECEEVYEWLVPRPGTNPLKMIARKPQ